MTTEVELRHLRSFVAVAEELNFTRAAERLFIAQQALSAQIRQLEGRVGVQLLVRTTRSVSLTPAGDALYGKARLLLDGADDAIAAARAAAVPGTVLTVGFVAAVDHPTVSHALDRFRDVEPEVALHVSFGDLLDPTGGLRDGHVDVAFVYGPFDRRGLSVTPLYRESMGVAMAETHPLAGRDGLTMEQFLDQPTFVFPTADRAWGAFWTAEGHRTAPAKTVGQFRTLEGLIAALRAGLGVNLATPQLVAAAGAGIVWLPLEGLEPLEHGIARRAADDRPVVGQLVNTVVDAFAS